jgi:hypothetical protein
MTVTINGTTGISIPTQFDTASTFGFKNRIINGAMVIDQRNEGASVTPANLAYTLDRWQAFQSVASKYSVQQNAGSVTPPTGFTNYLGVTSLSAYSVASGDYFALNQSIEGFNVADLSWGTASAATVTLSFWVRSSLTGTFGGALKNSASNRTYPFTYTISSANTWEQKTITIAGDTSGTWVTNSGLGIYVQLGLGTGSTWNGTAGSWSGGNYISATGATSVVGTNGATFYITGVQLEKGSTATSFDYRSIGQELLLCQRYYETTSYPSATQDLTTVTTQICWNASYCTGTKFLVAKRAAPTVTLYGRTGVAGAITSTASGAAIGGTSVANSISPVSYWAVNLGAAQTPYVTVLEVGYTASAEL